MSATSPFVPVADPAALAAADRIAHRLTVPAPTAPEERWRTQSLAGGSAGIALLHIARARAGLRGWHAAHAWLADAVHADVAATPDASLFLGAPAVAFAVHTAAADALGRYQRALSILDRSVSALTHRRIDQAHARLARRQRPRLAEFDVIGGLTGIGAHLLRHRPGDDVLERVLRYLVRLSEPLYDDGDVWPGWWTDQDPHAGSSAEFAGGHGNLGLAHGIAGPLALLALAARRGITVDGQREAMQRICGWLDTCRRDDDAGSWWPQWITWDEHRRGRASRPGPGRPSWCYGTPGIARAQQLAALATGDASRRALAEHALAACLSDHSQLHRIIDGSLCHGWAGLYQTAWRAADDAATPTIGDRLPALMDRLLEQAAPESSAGSGFLEGAAGIALALHTAADPDPTGPGWDACLLIT